MEIEYLRTSRNSYMIVKNADYEFENYELQMMLHNEIPSLLEIQVIVSDGAAEYLYDVTGMQSLEKQLSFLVLGEKQLRFLLQNLIYVKNAMEEFLLDDQNLSFSPAMIFYDRFTKKLRFCYIPGLAEHRQDDIRSLFEELLQHLDHSDSEAVRLGYDMYERCAQSEFLVEDCIDCLTNRKEGKGMWISEKQMAFCDGNQMLRRDERNTFFQEESTLYQEEEIFGDNGRFEKAGMNENKSSVERRRPSALETLSGREEKAGRFWKKKRRQKSRKQIDYSEILDEEQRRFYAAEEIPDAPETEIFSTEGQGCTWRLVYKGDGEEPDLSLESFPFWVGTDREKVQGVLMARTVSRVHARLYKEEDKIYLEDYNSTNGTYVNHRLIPMNTPTELQPGDRIFFATEEYVLDCHKF